jgi:DNA polymerase III delta prime subunit
VLRRSARGAGKRRVIVIDSDSDGAGDKDAAHGAKASSGEDDDGDADAPPPKRRSTRRTSGAAQGEVKKSNAFFLKPNERKQRKREAEEAAAAAAAQEAAVAAARAREDALDALRRERAEMRQMDATWNQGRTVHQFFSLTAKAAATAVAAAAAGADAAMGDGAAPVNMAATVPPWAPVHVGLPPVAAGVLAPLAWPPGMLAPPLAQRQAIAGVVTGDSAAVLTLPGMLVASPPQLETGVVAGAVAIAPVDTEAALEALDEYLHAPRNVARRGSDAATEWEDEAQDDSSAKGLCLQRLRARLQALTPSAERGEEEAGSWWCVRHAPRCASDVLCAGTGVTALRQWLAAWKAAACGDGGDPRVEVSTESRSLSASPPRAAKRHRRPDYGDFVGESSEDADGFIDDGSDEDGSGDGAAARRLPRPAFVLSGPPGCGKTAAIYAVACELGFSVIEVGANAPRAGADVLSRVGEATQSRRVKNAGPMAGALQAPVNTALGAAAALRSKPAPPSRRRAVILDDSSSEEERGEAAIAGGGDDVEPADGRIDDASGPNANHPGGDQTIILFDEADLLWHQDRGFAAAMAQLAGSAKRPLVMTVNDPTAVLHALPPKLHVHHSIGRLAGGDPLADGVAHLALVATAEGRACSPQVAAAVLAACDGDLRRAMTQLQVLTLPGRHGNTFNGGLADTTCEDELAAWKLLPTWQPAHEALSAGAASLTAAARLVLDGVEAAARAASQAHVTRLAAAATAAQAAKEEALRAAKAAKRALKAAERAAADGNAGDVVADGQQEGAPAPEAEDVAAAEAPITAEATCAAAGDDAAGPAAEDAPAVEMETGADGDAEAPTGAVAASPVPLPSLLASGGITVDARCPDMQLDVARVNHLAELTSCLSDAASMRCPAVVTCTGPRLPVGDSCVDDTLPPEMVYDASSPECGLDGGQPRGQLGGGAGTADLCSGSIALLCVSRMREACTSATCSLAARLARQSAQNSGSHVAPSTVPVPRLLAHVDSRRDMLNDLGAVQSVLASSACVADCLAFAARMARLEAAAAPAKALGRRRRQQARVRHIALDEEPLEELLAHGEFLTQQ